MQARWHIFSLMLLTIVLCFYKQEWGGGSNIEIHVPFGLKRCGCFGRIVKKRCNEGSAHLGQFRTKEKITKCGADLAAWGSLKSQPGSEEIKKLQK